MHRGFQLAIRSFSLLLLAACTPYLPPAQGTDRLRYATYVYELEQCADTATALENDYLALIERASDEERFHLYRHYNRLMGTWLQVDFLQILLDLAVEATSHWDEEEVRSTLRDHAQYVLWELDNAIDGLEDNSFDAQRLTHLWVDDSSRSLLSSVRITVNRLLVDYCAAAFAVFLTRRSGTRRFKSSTWRSPRRAAQLSIVRPQPPPTLSRDGECTNDEARLIDNSGSFAEFWRWR
jgi:hypothetical protein